MRTVGELRKFLGKWEEDNLLTAYEGMEEDGETSASIGVAIIVEGVPAAWFSMDEVKGNAVRKEGDDAVSQADGAA